MYIESVPNRNSPPCILLRESYREFGKTKKRTIANLSKLPKQLVAQLDALLRGGVLVDSFEKSLDIVRSLPHGHIAAVLGSVRRIGLDRILNSRPSREKTLVIAMIVARIINPASKLATARGLDTDTSFDSLSQTLEIDSVSADDLYAAMDWLLERQEHIEKKLARRHLVNGSLVLYDVTSTYFEGRSCPLAQYGHSRDGKKDKLQIVFGLLCNAEGCPVAVEVFEGNTADPATLRNQVEKLRHRFNLKRIILVGDRGLITEARLTHDIKPLEGLDWITALRAPQIQDLVKGGRLQLSLFDQRDLAEIKHPDFPGERLIVCRNPLLAGERTRKRNELLAATERELDKIVAATSRSVRPLRGKEKIGLRVGQVLGRFKMAKHFILDIQENGFSYTRNACGISEEAALDGFYVIRTSVPAAELSSEAAVAAYKQLSTVERAFRSYKSVDLKVRPIHHRLAPRVRAHVFLCMLAYYVEWHMRKALAPILFDDHDPQEGKNARLSIVAPAQRSPAAKRKARLKRTDDYFPVHSFRTLLKDLGTLTINRVQPKMPKAEPFDKFTTPTPVQQRALNLLGVKL